MTLTMEIVEPSARVGTDRKVTFSDTQDVTIGRDSGNRWILAHDTVSGKHAFIRCVNGRFVIYDGPVDERAKRSTNGTYVNEQRVEDSRELESGNHVTIGPYVFRVTIDADPVPSDQFPWSDDPSGQSGLDAQHPVDSAAPESPDPQSDSVKGGVPHASVVHEWEADLFNDPPPDAPGSDRAVGSDETEQHDEGWGSEADDRWQAEPSAGLNPPDNGMSGVAEESISGRGPNQAREESGRHHAVDAAFLLAEILKGAGVDPSEVSPGRAREIGSMLRVVVDGVRHLLEARQTLKRHFRMTGTIIERGRNNPLKFSASADEALRKLLTERDESYLDPLTAFKQAFRDLHNHQVAELEGMKAAYEAMLGQFNASRLQQRFDKQIQVSVPVPLPAAMAKLRYWDMYRQWLEEITEDPDSFRELFGRDFVRAYEAFVQRLESRSEGRREGEAKR